jgi:hypothetical protein
MLRWLIMGVTDYRDVTVAQYNADYGVDLLMYDAIASVLSAFRIPETVVCRESPCGRARIEA